MSLFEDTLLIIMSDYMHKRKPVLLKLLQVGFQIQGSRKLIFSPELAAEFLNTAADDKEFMLRVILLAKGTSEAFILTKENAVEELVNTMICYFSSSQEMERNVHVTRQPEHVRREIQYIFPNYIYEPIPVFQGPKFSANPIMQPLIEELFNIIKLSNAEKADWKMKLSEWLQLTNKTIPHITNQCSTAIAFNMEDKWQQVNFTPPTRHHSKRAPVSEPPTGDSPSTSNSSGGTSLLLTSSSCMSCDQFDATEKYIKQQRDKYFCEDLMAPKTARVLEFESEKKPKKKKKPKAEKPHDDDDDLCKECKDPDEPDSRDSDLPMVVVIDRKGQVPCDPEFLSSSSDKEEESCEHDIEKPKPKQVEEENPQDLIQNEQDIDCPHRMRPSTEPLRRVPT